MDTEDDGKEPEMPATENEKRSSSDLNGDDDNSGEGSVVDGARGQRTTTDKFKKLRQEATASSSSSSTADRKDEDHVMADVDSRVRAKNCTSAVNPMPSYEECEGLPDNHVLQHLEAGYVHIARIVPREEAEKMDVVLRRAAITAAERNPPCLSVNWPMGHSSQTNERNDGGGTGGSQVSTEPEWMETSGRSDLEDSSRDTYDADQVVSPESVASANSSDYDSTSSLNPLDTSGGLTTASEQEGDAEHDADGDDTDPNMQEPFEMPPHNFHHFREWYKREYGLRACQSPSLYCYRAMGSLYYVQRLELMCKMQNHDGCVNCLHFNSSGSRLASGSDDFNVNIWDWARNKPLTTFESGHRANVFQVKFMPLSGDCHIVTCGRDGQVRLAELSYGGICKSTRKLAHHRGAAHKLTLDPTSPHVFLSCGEDGVVLQIDLRDPKPEKLLTCREFGERPKKVPLYSIHSNPRNPFEFVVGGRDQFCRFYDKRLIRNPTAPVKKFCPHALVETPNGANVTCLVYNFDGSELLASYNDDDIYLFDTSHSDGADSIKRYRGHRNSATIKGVNFYGPRSEFVVSGSDCGYIYFWEKQSEKIVQFLPGDESGVVNVLEPHPTFPILATSGLDHDVKIWVPSCEEPKLNARLLRKTIKRNREDRANDIESSTGNFDTRTLFLIMSRMRRNARRRSENNTDGDGFGSGQENADSDDSDTDSAVDGPVTVNCRTS